MKSIRTKTTISLALNLMLLSGISAHAEQLAKSGNGTIHSGFQGVGTTTPIGDKRAYWTGAFWGVSFNDEGKGFLHEAAWNCPAITDINNNVMQTKGSCTLTDTAGDKVYGDWTGKGPVGGEFAGDLTISGGTGKYAGIQGSWDFHCGGIGTDNQLYCRQKYNYKMP
jgi:hypothetical protein